jgi:soluble lytic murein transglycosylase-like protein
MKKRVPLTIFLVTLGLLSFEPTPSDTAVPDPSQFAATSPAFDDDLALHDLALASEHRPLSSTPSTFRAITSDDLDAALTSTPQSYEIFQRDVGDSARRAFLRRLPFGTSIWRAAERHRVDGLLVAAIVEVESGFQPDAVSPKGAVGLMQVIPANGDPERLAQLVDPTVNLDTGSRYLGRLLRSFDGDLELAVAAYNAGPAAVERYRGVPPFPETRDYVRRVLALYQRHYERVWKQAGIGEDFVAASSLGRRR